MPCQILGLLAHTMGNMDAVAAHCEDGLFCRRAGFQPELGFTLSNYVDLLLARSITDDRAKATGLVNEALNISLKLDMQPFMEWVLARQEPLKA